MKRLPFAINLRTLEVFERVPERQWQAKLAAWIAQRRDRKCYYHHTLLPSPQSYGHIMFEVRKTNHHYRPVDKLPKPVWTDGIGAVYEGQYVGWQLFDRSSCYGHVQGLDNGLLLVKRWDDGTCLLDPLALS